MSNIFPFDFVLFVKNDSFLFLDFDLDLFYDSIENDFFFVNSVFYFVNYVIYLFVVALKDAYVEWKEWKEFLGCSIASSDGNLRYKFWRLHRDFEKGYSIDWTYNDKLIKYCS